ncbi:hypothetical protein T12_13767 [Trichinella patagoniensis]|uniref:Uncharacterized protein n=1 Tax=Trichinella patagoniensis TaxID=990121 RepID=A0A0V0ZUL4_9BILA|nr:hypothetical protein T12_13767 [Trichinella patagoniensis]
MSDQTSPMIMEEIQRKKKFVLPLLLLLQIAPLNIGEKRSAAAYIKVLRRRHVGV